MMWQWSVTAIHRILLDYAIFITTLLAAVFVSLFHHFIFTIIHIVGWAFVHTDNTASIPSMHNTDKTRRLD